MGFILNDRNEYYDILNSRRQLEQQASQYNALLQTNPEQVLENLEKYPTELDTGTCLLYTSPSPRDRQKSRMPSSA